jgi:hypothetical protein
VKRRNLCSEAIGEIFQTKQVVASEMSATRNGRSRMLRLTIELVPGGFEPLRRTIASMRISNMSDLADCSDYRVEAMETANALTGDPARNTECMVLDHDRKQSVWALLAKACHEILKANYDDRLDRKGLRTESLEGMMADSDAIKRLLERLQTGWAPKADEIEPTVPQVDALNWQWNFEDAGTIVPLGITYQTIDRQPHKTTGVLYINEHMTYALTAEGIFWLYRSEESEKVRYLGG